MGFQPPFRIDRRHTAHTGGGNRLSIGVIDTVSCGENPLDIDRLVTLLTTRWGGTHTQNGLVMAAISGLEIALWDLAGKLTGLPAYRLLGGTFRDRVRLYTLISVEPALAQWVVRLPVCSLPHWHPPTA